MKELWTANPFCLMNRPFAEMGYNSSGLNIAPSAFCWQLAGPSRTIRLLPAHHPSTLCAPPADAPQTICNTRHNIWRPPQAICRRSAQHLAVPCTASAISPQTIRHLTARHPLAPAPHPSALCKPSARQFTAQYSPAHRKPSVIARHSIRRPPRVIRWHPAGNLLARTDALTARRTNRRREQEPLIPALRNC